MVKESDRIAPMAAGSRACGVLVEEEAEGLHVVGTARANHEVAGVGVTASTHGDHPIAMSFLVLGLAARSPVSVDEPGMIATSFPGFTSLMATLGAHIDPLWTVGFVVAIDGPGRLGQGVRRGAARRGAWAPVLDTGLLYRAVGAAVERSGGDLDDEATAGSAARDLRPENLESEALRTRHAGEAASRVAVHPAVRTALLDFQRAFAAREPGAILDGRDIGTVVVPAAASKLFVTASPEVRARRRYAQLSAQGDPITYDAVLDDIKRRDARDGGRAAAPMTRAADAVLLDTTDLDIDAVFDAALRIVEASRGRWETS